VSVTRDRPAARAIPKPAAVREYVVLVKVGEGRYDEVGDGRGANDIVAIRDATKAMTAAERSRPFVAMAKSRFNVRSRKVETIERESWG
jgi:hypothetical protein